MAEFHDGPRPPLGLRRRGIYLLPNLFTSGVLFAGFFAIVQAMNGRFEAAAVAIYVAMVLDGLDGRVARWTRTTSEFGAQYDSLADMVAFGAAPALVIYVWALQGYGKLGWVAAFVHCAGAALRLARFNANIGIVDKRYFQGLPSPAAAALVAGLVWAMHDFEVERGDALRLLAWFVTVFAGLSMVSSVPFYSFKDFNPRKAVPFWVVAATAGAFALIALQPPLALFLLIAAYCLSGYVLYALGHRVKKKSPAAH